jgi:hypothetical protein
MYGFNLMCSVITKVCPDIGWDRHYNVLAALDVATSMVAVYSQCMAAFRR